MKKVTSILIGLGFTISSSVSYAQNSPKPIEAFSLNEVRLTGGAFLHAQQKDLDYILSLNADRLLAPYRKEAGLPVKAPAYGNWESSGLDGHIGGHYLSALALMYASTDDKRLKEKLDYCIAELALCQQQNKNGYVGGIPNGKIFWERIGKGDIDGSGFGLNNTWVPLYNIHKLFAGLRDAYLIGGNQEAKEVLIHLTDWFCNLIAPLNDTQIQQMLKTEHGGMNEVLADVYVITQQNKYLDAAERMSHQAILAPLVSHEDKLTGLHANTQIPKVIGFERIAELKNRQDWHSASEYFWQNVTQKRSVAFGGNSYREHFNATNDFKPMLESNQGPETCNSYNMLKLTKALFLHEPKSSYIDFYERTLYNHILSSQHPEHGGLVYFTPIRPQHYRVYSDAQKGFWCCVGSGIENHGKYAELIYAHDDKNIWVNLFVPSQLDWKERGIRFIQKTDFPNQESTVIQLSLKQTQKFKLYLRKPFWLNSEKILVKVNNQSQYLTVDAQGYASLEKTWKNGDKIQLVLPMQTRLEQLPDGSNWYAFAHGPIILAAATDSLDLKGLVADDSRMGHEAMGKLYPINQAPVLVGSQNTVLASLKSLKNTPLTYKIESPNLFFTQKTNLILKPFYQLHDARYMMYWPLMNANEVSQHQEKLKAEEQADIILRQKTVDWISLGEQQPEADHAFDGKQTRVGGSIGNFWRSTTAWMSYKLNNTDLKSKAIEITILKDSKAHAFEVWLNDTLSQKVEISAENGKSQVFTIGLGENILNQKNIQIKIVAIGENGSGAIQSIRLIK